MYLTDVVWKCILIYVSNILLFLIDLLFFPNYMSIYSLYLTFILKIMVCG